MCKQISHTCRASEKVKFLDDANMILSLNKTMYCDPLLEPSWQDGSNDES